MVHALGMALLICAAPGPPADAGVGGDEALRALWVGGRSWEAFRDAARRRVELWTRLSDESPVPADLLVRARAVGGSWRILAVAEDWCGDSAYNVPWIARLAQEVEGLELRIVDSRAGRGVMEAHRTADGRAATPTLLLLDATWSEVGCFVERPRPLAAWYEEHRRSMGSDELHEYIHDFYEEDHGRATLVDVVEMLEAAAAGGALCPARGRPQTATRSRPPRLAR